VSGCRGGAWCRHAGAMNCKPGTAPEDLLRARAWGWPARCRAARTARRPGSEGGQGQGLRRVRAQLPARGNKQGTAVSTISLGATMSGRDDLRNWADGVLNLGLGRTFGRSRIAKGSRGLLTVATKCVSLVMRLCRHNPEIPVLQRPYYSSVSPVPPFPHGGNSPARVKRTGLPSPVGSSGTSESVRGQTETGEAALTQRGSDVPAPQPTVCGGRSRAPDGVPC
jgi:hypothetical protein